MNYFVVVLFQVLNKTKRFLIVRHPFERLLSAYRDKLEFREDREYYYKRFGRHITYKYREREKLSNTSAEPTFYEFLQFIAKEKYFDEHWELYYDSCLPCSITYDYILRFETYNTDERFFIQMMHLNGYLYQEVKIRNSNPRGATTNNNILKSYYKYVPRSLLQELYKIYEKDFRLFSYSPQEYYDMSHND